jgi:hypothetical protein
MKQKLIKIGLVFSVLCIPTISANGQNTPEKSSGQFPHMVIGITGGFSSPSGNYTSTDYKDPKSGFAGSGTNFGATATWFLNKNFGISALVSYHSYSFQGIGNISKGFQEDFFTDSANALSKGGHHTVNILVGPYYSLPLSDKFSVDFRALIGVTDATLAGWDVILTDGGITHPALTQDVAHAVTFGMQAGVGLRYNINSSWAIMLNGDYFYSKPNFSIANEDRNANVGRKITSYNEAIAGVNVNFTLAYQLWR